MSQSLADETLGIFRDYLGELGPLSQRVANEVEAGGPVDSLGPLIDGLSLVNESIAQLELALQMQGQALSFSINSDLRSIVKELLDTQQSGDRSTRVEILRSRLPEHIGKWAQVSISR